jgi:hypothetical protein
MFDVRRSFVLRFEYVRKMEPAGEERQVWTAATCRRF